MIVWSSDPKQSETSPSMNQVVPGQRFTDLRQRGVATTARSETV